jgi:Protein-disulfide isomerase
MIPFFIAQESVDMQKLVEGIKPIVGVENAPIKIVLFTDPDCPYCRMTHGKLIEYAKNRPDVALYVRLFPLVQIHPNAYRKSEVLACTPEDKFPEVIKAIEERSAREPFSWDWINFDKKILQKIKDCVNKDLGKNRVEKDLSLGFSFGVRGTPTMFINGKKHVGAFRSVEDIDRVVRSYTE